MTSTHISRSDEPNTVSYEVARLRKQVAQLQDQLRRAQQLTALGELVGTTTHEFNNVLTTIINYAKLGLRHRDEATREKSLTQILMAGERAARITKSVLGMARNRGGRRQATDLAQLVEETLLLLDREMSKHRIRIERHFNTAPPALADANQIQQVLLNLLINARQAMPGGGLVVIRVGFEAGSGMVELVVRDMGCGIPQDKLPHIFEPFYSTKSGPDSTGKGGTGLGLSTCRNIIQAHQGRIRVESTVGRGTAITIKLPAVGVMDGTGADDRPPAEPNTPTM